MIVTRWIPALLLSALLAPLGGTAHRKTEAGNRQYADGEYGEALRNYTEAQIAAPEAAELFYDIGNVLFRQNDYQGAADAYSRALLSAPAPLVPGAAYNLGNARFEQKKYREAVEAYQRALRAAPQDADAKRNLELALLALEQQQKQQQQQQQQQDQQGQDKPPGDQPKPQDDSKGGEKGKDQQSGQDPGSPGDEQQPGRLSKEQAARLLDTLADQERDNLRRQLLQQQPGPERTPEKDW